MEARFDGYIPRLLHVVRAIDGSMLSREAHMTGGWTSSFAFPFTDLLHPREA